MKGRRRAKANQIHKRKRWLLHQSLCHLWRSKKTMSLTFSHITRQRKIIKEAEKMKIKSQKEVRILSKSDKKAQRIRSDRNRLKEMAMTWNTLWILQHIQESSTKMLQKPRVLPAILSHMELWISIKELKVKTISWQQLEALGMTKSKYRQNQQKMIISGQIMRRILESYKRSSKNNRHFIQRQDQNWTHEAMKKSKSMMLELWNQEREPWSIQIRQAIASR